MDYGFSVPFTFPLHFTRGVFAPANPLLAGIVRRLEPARRHRVLAVVDARVAATNPAVVDGIAQYASAHDLELVRAPVVVPGGEAVKNDLAHPLALLQKINDVGLDRQSFIAVVGGGAVLDMASFAAAIAHRGIRVLRVPTTVLSQADSGVGVKNSVNLFGKKNFIGTFVPPFAVINDHGGHVSVALDSGLRRLEVWNAHPLDNAMTTAVRGEDMVRYLEAMGHAPRWVEL